jgi:hypothetical protein
MPKNLQNNPKLCNITKENTKRNWINFLIRFVYFYVQGERCLSFKNEMRDNVTELFSNLFFLAFTHACYFKKCLSRKKKKKI